MVNGTWELESLVENELFEMYIGLGTNVMTGTVKKIAAGQIQV